MDLPYKHEKTLFTIAFVISTIFWLVLIVGTLGIALIYLLLLFVFYLFVQSAFIAYIKGTGVKLGPNQYPDLHERLIRCCNKIGMEKIPDTYLLRMDLFNALATRFLGRNFVVIFTDVVDALDKQPDAIDFYLGHELGHIHRKHLQWSSYLAPASILPLLGAGLRRAEEYTCDRYGTFCCKDTRDIQAALAAIASGDTRWSTINVDAYLEQRAQSEGFWMSYHELTNDYPWLTKRMAACLAFKRGDGVIQPGRSFFAWVLAAFTPRLGVGGAGSVLIIVAVIGILAAVALPAYQDYVSRAAYSTAYGAGLQVQDLANEYILENQSLPADMATLGLEGAYADFNTDGYSIEIYEGGLIGILVGYDNDGAEQYLVLEPLTENDTLEWVCYGQNLAPRNLPASCQ